MKEKEFYKQKIIEMIENISDSKVLEYFYYFIREKMKKAV